MSCIARHSAHVCPYSHRHFLRFQLVSVYSKEKKKKEERPKPRKRSSFHRKRLADCNPAINECKWCHGKQRARRVCVWVNSVMQESICKLLCTGSRIFASRYAGDGVELLLSLRGEKAHFKHREPVSPNQHFTICINRNWRFFLWASRPANSPPAKTDSSRLYRRLEAALYAHWGATADLNYKQCWWHQLGRNLNPSVVKSLSRWKFF